MFLLITVMRLLKLTFKYKLPPGLRGRPLRPGESGELYPLIPIRLYTKGFLSPPTESLLDSGSHGLFIPRRYAEVMKLKLGAKAQSTGVDGPYDAFHTKVGIKLGRGGREVDFGIIDAIVPQEEKDVPILIGRHPFFDMYQIVIVQYENKFHLIPKDRGWTRK